MARSVAPSHGLRPIRQPDSLVQRAFEALEESIVRGAIKPGSRLFEAGIARELAISRGPIREAIRRLEERGLVIRTHLKGAVVLELSADEVLELSLIREQVEGLAARLAATRVTADDVRELEGLLAGHQQRTEERGFVEYFQPVGELDFHYRIVKGADSDRLLRLFVREIYYPIRLYRFRSSTQGRAKAALQEHWAILDAIRSRDAELAERLMREHVARSRNTLVETFPAGICGDAKTKDGSGPDRHARTRRSVATGAPLEGPHRP
jgi:DNA-binding GntR family transcriptional regulator